MRKLLAWAVAALATLALAPATVQAETFNVNTEADGAPVAGACTTDPSCTLREAVDAVGASTDAEDTIVIPAGDYVLTQGELELQKTVVDGAVTLDGAGARTTTIDAAGSSRVFNLLDGDISMDDLTITGGSAPLAIGGDFPGDGGAILTIASSLALQRVAVTDSTAELNGGGIAAPPENGSATAVTLTDSTVAGNAVTGGLAEGLGGGVYVFGDVSVTNSTISGNSADNPGIGMGGGLVAAIDPAETDGTTLSVLNSTIAGNILATGGMGAGIAVVNPTPGVVTTVDIKNTIVASNTIGGTAGDCSLLSLPTSANNLSSDASCQFTDEGSLQSTDPQLGALADNGGPTDTRALPAGSPAIDAGTNDGCPPADQRGIARPQGTTCDIGAFERVLDPTPPPAEPSADLALKLKAKPKRPRPGKRVKLTLTARNAGPDAATGTVVKGRAPKSVKKIKGARSCKLEKRKGKNRRFTCRIGELKAGSRVTLKAKARVGKKAKNVRANARVDSAVADPNRKNNKVKVKAKVKRPKK